MNDVERESSVEGWLNRGPLAECHGSAVRLVTRAEAYQDWAGAGLLAGKRTFGWPMLALTAKRDLGKVRHALSQRTVAGTMVVTPPFHICSDPHPSAEGEPNGSSMTTGAD